MIMLEVSSEPIMIAWVSCFFRATFALDCFALASLYAILFKFITSKRLERNSGVLGKVISDSGG